MSFHPAIAALTKRGAFAALIMAFFAAACCFFFPNAMFRTDALVYDAWLMRSEEPAPPDIPIVIIDIDDKSLSEVGQWPWPRTLLARMASKINAAGVRACGWDVLFAERDRFSKDAVKEFLRGENMPMPDSWPDGDADFDAALHAGPHVIAVFVTNGADPPDKGIGYGEREDGSNRHRPKVYDSVIRPVYDGVPTGHIDMDADEDGLLRRVSPVMHAMQTHHAILGLRMFMLANKARSVSYDRAEERLRVKGVRLPVDNEGCMLLPFRGKSPIYAHVSASDVMKDGFDANILRGKYVLIGSSATGLKDFRPTPCDHAFFGVEAHAAFIDAILTDRRIAFLPHRDVTMPAIALGSGLVVVALSCVSATSALSIGTLLMLCVLPFLSLVAFNYGWWAGPSWPMLAACLSFSSAFGTRFLASAKERRRIRRMFERCVAPAVVSQMVDKGGAESRQEDISVLFTDLRGFTRISENLSPDQLNLLLSRYFTPMTDIVFSHGGTLDKYIGDALMAFWNAPVAVANYEEKSCAAALAMQEAMASVRNDISGIYGGPLAMGAGLAAGSACVGPIGSRDFMNYTAIGDVVNLASRLEGLCKKFGVPVIADGELAKCSNHPAAFLANLHVKGRRTVCSAWAIFPKDTDMLFHIERWNLAVIPYAEGRGDEPDFDAWPDAFLPKAREVWKKASGKNLEDFWEMKEK